MLPALEGSGRARVQYHQPAWGRASCRHGLISRHSSRSSLQTAAAASSLHSSVFAAHFDARLFTAPPACTFLVRSTMITGC